MKKNCKNCKFLDYYEAGPEEFATSGYYCEARDDENVTSRMEEDSYLEKAKVCCDIKI